MAHISAKPKKLFFISIPLSRTAENRRPAFKPTAAAASDGPQAVVRVTAIAKLNVCGYRIGLGNEKGKDSA
jgi:hypothetical protein